MSTLSRIDAQSLTVQDALVEREGYEAAPPLTFQRIDLPVDFVEDSCKEEHRESRHLATYPPSSHIDLQASLGKFIASGRSGLVYEVQTPTNVVGSDGRHVRVPPLVCKIAARERNKCLAREAWFYDEMQTIQGIAIPRCFGFFEAVIPPGREQDFLPWSSAANDPSSDDSSPDAYLKKPEQLYKDLYVGGFQETPANRTILTRLEDPKRVVLLLLERLGGEFLTVGISTPDEIRNDAFAAYDVLAELGFEHFDIRIDNLLQTLNSPFSLPGLPSPLHGRTFKCRIIDFEISRKSPGSSDWLKYCMHGPLTKLIENLPFGDIINQRHY